MLNLNTFAVDTYNLGQLFTMDSSVQNLVQQEIRHRLPHDSLPSGTNKYQEIHVLLFSWIDDDLNSSREALRVGRAFSRSRASITPRYLLRILTPMLRELLTISNELALIKRLCLLSGTVDMEALI
jgi:hypothetical protein